MTLSRRQFLGAAGAAGALAATGGATAAARAATSASATSSFIPAPDHSGIEHIIVLCMENRSFDHYLGWVKGAAGRQAGLTYLDDDGNAHTTHRLKTWTGCGNADPDHSYKGGRIQYADGKLDGFRKGGNDNFALGYYVEDDLPTMSQLVKHFTVCDHWFAGILSSTYPNRIYTHAAATDRISNTMTVSKLPTIWDRLGAAGISRGYYFHDLPVLALWGQKYLPIAKPFETFFLQAKLGLLPQYTYLDPSFLGEGQGSTNDDHPAADIRRGQNLIARVVKAVTESPLWEKTVLIITYDEWGGFFDHVKPPRFPDLVSNPGGDEAHPDHGQAGFRVPTFVISPFAKPGKVATTVFEHGAIPKFAEWRWGLKPLTPRDQAAKTLACVLDFSAPNKKPPSIVVPPDPGPHLCQGSIGLDPDPTEEGVAHPDAMGMDAEPFWEEMAASPLMRGWR